MTRKEIVTNTYGYGGLFGAIAFGIFAFVCTTNQPWHFRLFSVIVMTVMTPGITGVVLGIVAFILTLPFYRSIPWDLVESVVEENTGCRYCSTTLYKKLDYDDSSTEFCNDDCEGAWMRGFRKEPDPIPISDRFEILDL
jgi:hypothetical protein